MADELKPCPFCGEQPRTIDDDSYGACMVFCIKCDYTPDQCFKKVGELDQAIAVWNTRAVAPPEPSEAWQPIETVPENGEFLVGVWEGEWRETRKWFRVYEAWNDRHGLRWAKSYRTEEGEACEAVGWMPKPQPPAPPPEPSEADPQIATLIDLMRRASAAGLHKTAASLELDIAALRAAKEKEHG